MTKRQQRILKTEIEVSVGMSVQVLGGDWIKTANTIRTHIGPGYPEPEMLMKCMSGQLNDAMLGCSEQLNILAEESNRKVRELMNGNQTA